MTTMKVKGLIEALKELDPELPIHSYDGCNGMMPIDVEYAGYKFKLLDLMQSNNDPSYYAVINDPTWKNMKDQFGEPFKAVVIS
jgi:hypothetical protein